MGWVDRLNRLQRKASDDLPLVVCTECGAEARLRSDPQLELVVLKWRMNRLGLAEPPRDTPPDIAWIFHHPCPPLALVDKRTGAPALGVHFANMAREREHFEDYDDED